MQKNTSKHRIEQNEGREPVRGGWVGWDGGERRWSGGGGERNKQQKTCFFVFVLLLQILFFFLFSLPLSPARSPLARSLALFRTLADMSRASAARSALRALAATATGAGAAAPVRAAFFLHGIFPRSLSSRFARCSACGSGDVLRCLSSSSQRGRSSRFFSPDCRFAVRSGPRAGEMKQKGPPWPAKARAEKHASAFPLRGPCRIFFSSSTFLLLLRLSLSLQPCSTGPLSAPPHAHSHKLSLGGKSVRFFESFPAHRDSFFFSFQLNEKQKKLQASSAVAAAAAACCSFAPSSSSRLASFSPQPSRGFAAGASTTDLTSEIEHATGLER